MQRHLQPVVFRVRQSGTSPSLPDWPDNLLRKIEGRRNCLDKKRKEKKTKKKHVHGNYKFVTFFNACSALDVQSIVSFLSSNTILLQFARIMVVVLRPLASTVVDYAVASSFICTSPISYSSEPFVSTANQFFVALKSCSKRKEISDKTQVRRAMGLTDEEESSKTQSWIMKEKANNQIEGGEQKSKWREGKKRARVSQHLATPRVKDHSFHISIHLTSLSRAFVLVYTRNGTRVVLFSLCVILPVVVVIFRWPSSLQSLMSSSCETKRLRHHGCRAHSLCGWSVLSLGPFLSATPVVSRRRIGQVIQRWSPPPTNDNQ
ncbi:hypothetical protein OUZ56_003112 [Daphnia magna]|uniref:Uncharacterized protein n=1 Tax=Daphnia magna TaxID=35525 RepID=A0ABR0A7Z0_9CRUS|nr:hypothetical protein OUZ56_003112 [Daphnia magna]